MDKAKIISVIIPVYRNEGALKLTFEKVRSVFETILVGYDYEFVFVNDGSDDNSLNELIELSQVSKKVRVISLSRNFGQMAALVAGFKACIGDIGVSLSADLQDPPSLIAEMVKSSERGNEIVIGYRASRDDSFFSNATSGIFYNLMHWANPRIPKGGFDYVLMTRKPINEFNKIDERNRFFQGDIVWLGFPIQYLPYVRLKREIGKSQWGFKKKLKYFIDGLLNTSYAPIRTMTLVGFLVALIGFAYSFVVFYLWLMNNLPFKGYPVIVILILIIGGVNMLMLGVIGEYLWRIYDETRKRPLYIVDKEYGRFKRDEE
jgi:polyisoprenyl-phosphate glycosyltransferase